MCDVVILFGHTIFAEGIAGIKAEVRHAIPQSEHAAVNLHIDAGFHVPAQPFGTAGS